MVIARSLAREARVVIFDEPTSILSPAESDRLFGVIESLRADGITMLYVSHRMPEVFALSQHIHVLRDGRHVGDWPTAEVARTRLSPRWSAGSWPARSTGPPARPAIRRRRRGWP